LFSLRIYYKLRFGVDDYEWKANFRRQLTSAAQPTYEMDKLTTELLARKMPQENRRTESAKEEITSLPDELRMRDSTALPGPMYVLDPFKGGKL
jgi:DNA-binding LacI/PurR family transcriptional regulator